MRRITLSLLFLAAALPAAAEEISLKDGTKIIGHMTALLGDKIEVETAYGKMQLKRSDILTISFPENGAGPATSASASVAKKEALPVIDDSLKGTQYVNKTGKFSLTIPADWKINPSLLRAPVSVAGLSSKDEMRFLLVSQEEYTGSLESYQGIAEIQARKNLANYEKIMESPMTIDGKSALMVSYRGTLPKTDNLPVQFLVAIIASGNTFTRVSTWCVEPLFHETQPTFEKILNSYHSTGPTSAAASSRP